MNRVPFLVLFERWDNIFLVRIYDDEQDNSKLTEYYIWMNVQAMPEEYCSFQKNFDSTIHLSKYSRVRKHHDKEQLLLFLKMDVRYSKKKLVFELHAMNQ